VHRLIHLLRIAAQVVHLPWTQRQPQSRSAVNAANYKPS
jgi:hypothetical protein